MSQGISELPADQQVLIALICVEGLSYKEASDVLEVPIGTVMSRLHRGRKQLQRRLWDFGRERGLLPDEPSTPSPGHETARQQGG